MDVLLLTLAATMTALATGIGTIPVLMLGPRAALLAPALWGAAGGVMAVAAVLGLLVPALEQGGATEALGGVVAGVLALSAASLALRRRRGLHLGALEGAGARRGLLVAGALFAHSLPEGLAIGAAWSSGGAPGAFVVIAITLQNIPEGTVTAIGLREAQLGSARVFWTAVGTSAPQVPGALVAYWAVNAADGVLGLAYGAAAGAMLALVALEIVPAASERPRLGVYGALIGTGLAVALALALQV